MGCCKDGGGFDALGWLVVLPLVVLSIPIGIVIGWKCCGMVGALLGPFACTIRLVPF